MATASASPVRQRAGHEAPDGFDFRAAYSEAVRRQEDASVGDADPLTAVDVTLETIVRLHEAIDDSLHADAFAAALQGLRYSESLMSGGEDPTVAAARRHADVPPPEPSWLSEVLNGPHLEGRVPHAVLQERRDTFRALRKREVELLLAFERRRASHALRQYGPGTRSEFAPRPPPRHVSRLVQQRLLTPRGGAGHDAAVSPKPSFGSEAMASSRADEYPDEPPLMRVPKPAPPRPDPTAASAQAGIEAARAKFEARHGRSQQQQQQQQQPRPGHQSRRGAQPHQQAAPVGQDSPLGASQLHMVAGDVSIEHRRLSRSSGFAGAASSSVQARSFGGGSELISRRASTATTGTAGGATSVVTDALGSRSPPRAMPGQSPAMHASDAPDATLGTPKHQSLPRLRPAPSPVDAALAHAANIDRSVLLAASVAREARSALAASTHNSVAPSPTLPHSQSAAGASSLGFSRNATPSVPMGGTTPGGDPALRQLATPGDLQLASVSGRRDVGVLGAAAVGSEQHLGPHTPSEQSVMRHASFAGSDGRLSSHPGGTPGGKPPMPQHLRSPASSVARLDHAQFERFRDEQRRHMRGRPAREFDSEHANPLATSFDRRGESVSRPSTTDAASSFAQGVVAQAEGAALHTAEDVAAAARGVERIEALVASDGAAMVAAERDRLRFMTDDAALPDAAAGLDDVVSGGTAATTSPTRRIPPGRIVPYAIRAARPEREPTLMEHLLSLPNAPEIIEHLTQPVGMTLYQTVDAWAAVCRMQRAWRCASAKAELAKRKAKAKAYCEVQLPQLDALEVIVRVLRGCVARTKYAATRERVHHVAEQRVALENDPAKHGASGAGGEWTSTASFSISRGGRKRGKLEGLAVYQLPFGDAAPERREQLISVQRSLAARAVQRAWASYRLHKLLDEAAEVNTMMRVVTKKPLTVGEGLDALRRESSTAEDAAFDIPQLVPSAAPSQSPSRRGSDFSTHGVFVPLKGVKLSELEAQRRERDEQERLRRLQAEELLREKLMRQREELRKRTAATLLIQRVCRAYRRRLFLFAKKLSIGGGRFLVSANPFVRSLTVHHMRKQVPYGAHTEITRIISKRSPHLIPELRVAMERERERNVTFVQTVLRAAHAAVHRAALRRFFAARRVQRRWRLVRHEFRRRHEQLEHAAQRTVQSNSSRSVASLQSRPTPNLVYLRGLEGSPPRLAPVDPVPRQVAQYVLPGAV